MVDVLLCRSRDGIERFGVDEIAARIAEDAGSQIEVAEGSATGVARTARREFAGKVAGALNAVG